ncbi:hypothetical protein WICMUC_002420 [Wickerhamomyces mucosus]|uniref:Protein kinase domain-containing protein n=1 Tax=Wickerhamomyces mucosus TaxID=1378264 RepID=A0A9P8PPP2_9ASCO|nr:hypothetical protein WICMUC_002420 [Wickerhamomyces mucosus]
MNFLKSISNTLIGPSIPYSIGLDHNIDGSIWKINDGSRKSDSLPVSIFQFNKSTNSKVNNELKFASNAAKFFKSLKLPNVINVLDVIEDDSIIYIITERIISLQEYLLKCNDINDDLKLLIIYQVTKCLKFLNVEGNSILGQLWLNNIFINQDGLIKIGGFEIISKKNENNFDLINIKDPRFNLSGIIPPELQNNSGKLNKLDSFQLGIFIFKLFNLNQSNFQIQDLNRNGFINNIPRIILSDFKKLITNSLTVKLSIEQFWSSIEMKLVENIELIQIFEKFIQDYPFYQSQDEKLNNLIEISNHLYLQGFYENKILVELIKIYNNSPSNLNILQIILSHDIAIELKDHIFINSIKPIIFKSFTIPDRSIRLYLLTIILPSIITKLSKSEINDKIFPNFITGFADSNGKIRQESLKQILNLVPYLNSRQLNNDILRILAKLQTDELVEIRTLTTLILSKISEYLDKSTRSNVLAIAFGKALKDQFLSTRFAALKALDENIEIFSPEVIANKILTVIAPGLLDKSLQIRTESKKLFEKYLNKVYDQSNNLSDDIKQEEIITFDFENALNQLNLSKDNNVKSNDESQSSKIEGGFNLNHTISSSDSLVKEISKTLQKPSSWNDDVNVDDNDGWGFGSDDEIDGNETFHESNEIKPKINRLVTESTTKSSKKSTPIKQNRNISNTGGGGLKLKPKSKLQQLNLEPQDDDDDWGDGW